MPDAPSRRRLAKLYAGSIEVSDELLSEVSARTEGSSGAFIKELMRKTALAMLERGETRADSTHLELALGDMLTRSSDLNSKLLGAAEQ